ncbi:MAG: hypothetical protein ACE5K1_10640 [Acidiferrobacterales bacterium]
MNTISQSFYPQFPVVSQHVARETRPYRAGRALIEEVYAIIAGVFSVLFQGRPGGLEQLSDHLLIDIGYKRDRC